MELTERFIKQQQNSVELAYPPSLSYSFKDIDSDMIDYYTQLSNDLEEEDKFLSMDNDSTTLIHKLDNPTKLDKQDGFISRTNLSSLINEKLIVSKISLIIETKNSYDSIEINDLISTNMIILLNNISNRTNLFDKLVVDKLLDNSDFDSTNSLNYLELEIFNERKNTNNFVYVLSSINLSLYSTMININKYNFKYKITFYKNKKLIENFFNKSKQTGIDELIVESQKQFSIITKSNQKIILNLNHSIPIIFIIIDNHIIPEKFIFELDDSKIIFTLGDWNEYKINNKNIYLLTFDEQFRETKNLQKFLNKELEPKDFNSINFSQIYRSVLKIQTRTLIDYNINLLAYNINWIRAFIGNYGLKFSC